MELDVLYQKVEEMKRKQDEDGDLLHTIDKILVRGNGKPSLQEDVRSLRKAFFDFVDEVHLEREKRETKEEGEVKIKREEKIKWKWAFIGLGFAVIPPLLIQAMYFWTTLVPLVEKMKSLP